MHAQSTHLVEGQDGHQKGEVSLGKDHHGLQEDMASHLMVVAMWLELVTAEGTQGHNHRKVPG